MAEQSVVRSGFRLVREIVAMHPGPFYIAVTGAAVYAAATVGSTIVLGQITDRVIDPAFTTGEVAPGTVRWAIAAVFAITFLRIGGVVMRRYFAGMTSERAQRSFRQRLTGKYLDLPLAWHHRTPTGQLLAHADNDTEVATELLHPLPFSLGVAFLALFSAISLLTIDLWLALVAFLIFPALTILNQVYSRRIEGPAAEVQAAVGQVSSTAHESFDGALVVKTLGRAKAEGERFGNAAHTLRANRVGVGYIRAAFEAVMDALPSLGIVLVVVFGTYRINAGAITRGDLVQVAVLFTVLSLPMRVLGFFLEMMPPSVVSRRRLNMVFDEPNPDPIADPVTLPPGPLSLEVTDLTYGYPMLSAADSATGNRTTIGADDRIGEDGEEPAPILSGVSLMIEPGQVVALVGSTGSGKSTLCQLVSGLIPPADGTIKIGGQPVRHITDSDRTDAVSLVFQESFLFADTLRSNIDLVGDVSDADLQRAARIAQVDEFVAELPAGYDTIVGERGVTLSGGQRQRVALARALVRNPRLLLLDDATSAVDPKVEQRILSGLRGGNPGSGNLGNGSLNNGELAEPPTSLIVAQRVSTIKLADRVLYLSDGRIVGDGPHEQLMSIPGYAALVRAYEAVNQ
ncbi:MAG: ABC transporter ATP-binding protein [Acidimicrobiales bacterium]